MIILASCHWVRWSFDGSCRLTQFWRLELKVSTESCWACSFFPHWTCAWWNWFRLQVSLCISSSSSSRSLLYSCIELDLSRCCKFQMRSVGFGPNRNQSCPKWRDSLGLLHISSWVHTRPKEVSLSPAASRSRTSHCCRGYRWSHFSCKVSFRCCSVHQNCLCPISSTW